MVSYAPSGETSYGVGTWSHREDTETYYTLFVIDLPSRQVRILDSTPHPDELFMRQIGRTSGVRLGLSTTAYRAA